MENIAQRNP